MTTVVTAWHVETDAFRLRRLGKALEENNELGNVLARCIIQGVDEVDPSSGEVNRLRMQKEIADVYTQLGWLVECFDLDKDFIISRMQDKSDSMHKWEELLVEEQKDWRIDHSAGRPILVKNDCSVIEAQDAEYVLNLIKQDEQRNSS
jgi:hypothetical protein